MAFLKDVINTVGDSIERFNEGAWILFKNQIENAITPQFQYMGWVGSEKPLLDRSFDFIEGSNRTVKGLDKKKPNFSYYTNNGIKDKLNENADFDEFSYIDAANATLKDVTVDNEVKINTAGKHEQTYKFTHEGSIDKLTSYFYQKEGYEQFSGNTGGIATLDKVNYSPDITNYNGETLLSKTKKWFSGESNDYISKRFTTTISRFHTPNSEEISSSIGMQTGSKYGLSHGRNLLKAEKTNENGYDDPYCRVWKWHKQYSKYKDTMRPFHDADGNTVNISDLDSWTQFRNTNSLGKGVNGSTRLQTHGVMYDDNGNTNGLVNITPSTSDNTKLDVSIKKCMFSIENLAWKGTYSSWNDNDINGLSSEQKGPLGGRIMWFPPYDLNFSENSDARWEENNFIGRGEPIYTYTNTSRSGTLSFKLLIDHPAVLDYWESKNSDSNEESGVDDIGSKEQTMLRFFAGCEILQAKPKTESDNQPKLEKDKKENEKPEEEPTKKIKFAVFFPNNYSGVSDNGDDKLRPINYLLNGVGAGLVGPNSQEFMVDVNKKITLADGMIQVGGYEMRPDIGISIVQSATTTNDIINIVVDNQSKTLVKMVGSGAEQATSGNTCEWNKKRYYYRVDKIDGIPNQVLVGEKDNCAVSYIDKESHQWNSIGYSDACSRLGITDEGLICSFTDFYVALNGGKIDNLIGLYNENNVTLIRNIIEGKSGEIEEVICYGYASGQGKDDINIKLSNNRRKTIIGWLEERFGKDKVKPGDIDAREKAGTGNQDDSNDENAKLNRHTRVEVIYKPSKEEDGNASSAQINKDRQQQSYNVSKESKAPVIEENAKKLYLDTKASKDNLGRYDSEARFFKRLTKEDPFITKLLSDRIKNFDPVFHSMSPEGFNARATFLNQCMRQGPTISSSDTEGLNANNLAFGRPPVCVLRIGDFYNTKIIIKNLSITYDPLLWDLNQEGIGVMPMIANVTIQFSFIGGSDLGGPIQRLQNATSFNYYANASVYDNRAEEIEYKDGNMSQFKAFQPTVTEKLQEE